MVSILYICTAAQSREKEIWTFSQIWAGLFYNNKVPCEDEQNLFIHKKLQGENFSFLSWPGQCQKHKSRQDAQDSPWMRHLHSGWCRRPWDDSEPLPAATSRMGGRKGWASQQTKEEPRHQIYEYLIWFWWNPFAYSSQKYLDAFCSEYRIQN